MLFGNKNIFPRGYISKKYGKSVSEHAGFSFNKEDDERIKKAIAPYMMWFDMVADSIHEIVKMDEEKDRWYKKQKLEEIIKYNH